MGLEFHGTMVYGLSKAGYNRGIEMNSSSHSIPARPRLVKRAVLLLTVAALGLTAVACSSLDDREEAALDGYKQNSKSYYNSGKYMEAINQCYKGLELDEDDYSLNLTLGWALLKSGTKQNLFAAEKQFKITEDLTWLEDDYRVSLGLGEVCYRIATLYRQKLDFYTEKVAEDPDNLTLYAEEMMECREGMEQRLEEAIENLERTREYERQRDNIDAILLLGQAHAYARNLDKAVEYIQYGLDQLESSTSFQQSRIDHDRNMTGDGRRYFERQIRRNLRWEKDFRGILAFVFSLQEQYDKALEQYNLLEARDLFDDNQHYNRALALMELGRYAEALEEFDLYLKRAGAAGKQFDEDEHFHRAFQKMEECRRHLNQTSGREVTSGQRG
jgi:tetratricopeptide (TPR) repeat protein